MSVRMEFKNELLLIFYLGIWELDKSNTFPRSIFLSIRRFLSHFFVLSHPSSSLISSSLL